MINLLDLIGPDTQLKRTSANHGGEYSGPCPLCQRGTDRFKVWPQLDRWACLGPKAGRSGCDRGGDAIQYLRDRDRISYRQARERLGVNNFTTEAQIQRRGAEAQRRRGRRGGRSVVSSSIFSAISAPLRLCVESAPACVDPPNPTWQAHARALAARCEAMLWSATGRTARDYLNRRGLSDDTLAAFHIGYNPQDLYEDHAQWGLAPPDLTLTGLSAQPRHVWLPRGITIPWFADGAIWRLNVRRPLSPAQIAGGQAKYIGPAGFANALYNADALWGWNNQPPPQVAVLVEGEIDALTLVEACRRIAIGVSIAPVATGSTAGARRYPWMRRLASIPLVLVAFDHEAGTGGTLGAGDRASAWWLAALPNACRWQPPLHDINTNAQPEVVAGWLTNALAALRSPTFPRPRQHAG